MTLPAKTDFLNVGFTERQADALVELFRRYRCPHSTIWKSSATSSTAALWSFSCSP